MNPHLVVLSTLLLLTVATRAEEPVGAPADTEGESGRTQILSDGTIYWTALKPFGRQRVHIEAVDTGNIYLVDLSASETADGAPIEVSIPEGRKAAPPADPAGAGVAEKGSAAADYVTLTRMAAQHLYAPERLLQVPKGVHRTPVGREPRIDLIRGGRVEATPLIAWRSGGTYITAVKLRNRTFEDVILDPRTLRGAWLACTFQHARLYRKGDERDVTAAYLVSSRPFEDALDGRQ
jgi:integrating conjugative element protein (TIGR03749 family)